MPLNIGKPRRWLTIGKSDTMDYIFEIFQSIPAVLVDLLCRRRSDCRYKFTGNRLL